MADINPALFVDHEGSLYLFWYPVLGGRWESSQPKYLKAEKGHYESANGYTGVPDWDWQDAIYVKIGGNFSGGDDAVESEKVDTGMTDGRYNDPYTQLLNEKYAELKEYLFKPVEQGGAGVSQAFYGEEYESFVQERLDLSLGKLFSLSEGVPYARRLGWQTKDKPLEIQYNGGWRIILPLYSDTMECTVMALSDDGGETWAFSEPIIGMANIQASMAQRSDGTIVAYMRDNGPIPQRVVEAESADGGETWTIGKDRQDLFDPGVGSDLVELKTETGSLSTTTTSLGASPWLLPCPRTRARPGPTAATLLWIPAATPEISTIPPSLRDRTARSSSPTPSTTRAATVSWRAATTSSTSRSTRIGSKLATAKSRSIPMTSSPMRCPVRPLI
mgnify:CR=1 FL=1